MKKQSLMTGTVLLLGSAVCTKLLGALFKLPLTNLLGGTGMGYFGSAYGLFLMIYALSASGMSSAVAKLTAEAVAQGVCHTARRLKSLSLLWFSLIGLLGTAIMLLGAKVFCVSVAENPDAYLSVLVLAPSLLISCVAAVYRGYYEGLRCMMPTAVSQLAEAAVRFFCGLWLCRLTLANGEAVLAVLPEGTSLLAAASAAAVGGVTISSAAGLLVLVLMDLFCGDRSLQQSDSHEPCASWRVQTKNLFAILVPVALGALASNLTSLIDLATGIRGVTAAILRDPQRFSVFGMESASQTANFLFGCFTGLSVTVFNLVPSVTNMLGKSALPAVASAYARRDSQTLARDSAAVLETTAILAFPAGMGLAFLSRQILAFLFPDRVLEVYAAAPSLMWLGIGVGALCISGTLFSMLQAIGKARLPVCLMLIGVVVKLVGNLILIPLPSLHISGAGAATALCYTVIAVLALRAYGRETGIHLPLCSMFLPPAYASLMCAMSAVLAHSLLASHLGRLTLPAAVAAGGVVYLIVLRTIRPRREKS